MLQCLELDFSSLFFQKICLWVYASQRFDVAFSVCCWPESKAHRGTLRLIYRLSVERRLCWKSTTLRTESCWGHFVIACKWFLSVFISVLHGFHITCTWLVTFSVTQTPSVALGTGSVDGWRMQWHHVPLHPCKSNCVFAQMAVLKWEDCEDKKDYSALFFD